MLLIVHLLAGAAIASEIKTVPLALLLAFLSHFVLDSIPHWEYSIENIESKKWVKSLPDFFKVAMDFSAGLMIILLYTRNSIIIAGALFAASNDGLAFLNLIFENKFLKAGYGFHKKLHYLNNSKKVPLYLRIICEVIVGTIMVLILMNK